MQITGNLTQRKAVQNGVSKQGKEWSKQIFHIDTGAQYNSEAHFYVFGVDKINELERLPIGTKITIHFNINSKEFNGKSYTDLEAWKIEPFTADAVTENKFEDDPFA